ncbi:retrovirus-related pol polyprotein from transposon TNT 1-94 [Tanacetum coccineum]
MAAISNVPQLVDKKRGNYSVVAPRLEPGKFNKWKKRMLCYLTGMEPYYIQCIKDGPFKPKTAEDDIIEAVISYETDKDTWIDLVYSFKGPFDTKINRIMDLKLKFVYEDNLLSRRYSDTKKAIITTLSDSPISTAFFSNNIVQDFQENSNDAADERTSEEYLRDLDIEFHKRALLENSKCFIKRKNNFSVQKANEDTECYKCGKKGHFARD